ncbi:MAG: hypothetical protein WC551_02650 [Patescibacteria group bacterium]
MTTKLGALWKKTSQKGEVFMSGEIEIDGKKTKIVVFKNSHKEQEKHPDYNIILGSEIGQRPATQEQVTEPKQGVGEQEIEIDIGSIPF